MSHSEPTSIIITDTDAVVRSSNRSTPTVAMVLGRETRAGTEIVWLDRRVHAEGEIFSDGWAVSGAISSIFSRQVGAL